MRADLGQAPADAGEAFDGGLGFANGAGWVFEEVVVRGDDVVVEFVAFAGPVEPTACLPESIYRENRNDLNRW
jgi:hypothetical protein